LLDVFLVLTALLGAWFTGAWISGPSLDTFHPGLLPADSSRRPDRLGPGPPMSASAGSGVGHARAGPMILPGSFGLESAWRGCCSGRCRPPAAAPLAIEVRARLGRDSGLLRAGRRRVNTVPHSSAATALLIALARWRLLPPTCGCRSCPAWAFTFTGLAVATADSNWLNDIRPAYRVASPSCSLRSRTDRLHRDPHFDRGRAAPAHAQAGRRREKH